MTSNSDLVKRLREHLERDEIVARDYGSDGLDIGGDIEESANALEATEALLAKAHHVLQIIAGKLSKAELAGIALKEIDDAT